MSPAAKALTTQIARGLDAIPAEEERRLTLIELIMQLNALATRVGIPRATIATACARGRKAGLQS